ncbi:unnamed protein product [Cunninghamella echinulata]
MSSSSSSSTCVMHSSRFTEHFNINYQVSQSSSWSTSKTSIFSEESSSNYKSFEELSSSSSSSSSSSMDLHVSSKLKRFFRLKRKNST